MASIVFSLAILMNAACSEPLEFADWSVPVAEGTRIIEYPVVPFEERAERIELVEDLVIGQRDEDPDYIFYRPRGVLADSGGRIFVLDGGNYRVQVFDVNGAYVRTLGSEGQGPGELAQPTGIALAGDHLVVHDTQNAKFSIWSAEGDHLGDARFTGGRGPVGVVGLASGALAGRHLRPQPNEQGDGFTLLYELAIFSQEAEKTLSLQEFPRFEPITVRRAMSDGRIMILTVAAPSPRLDFAATPDGDIYGTFCAEYQIHAFDETGRPRWALRLPWERIPFTQQDIDETLESMRERIEDVDMSEVDWPERYPALDTLKVDGHGRLWVFPFFKPEDSDERPVDVYSRDGEHLFSGWIPRMTWDFALGDYVYGRESDDETGEERITRYRLVWPE
jgi:hypothetical protein